MNNYTLSIKIQRYTFYFKEKKEKSTDFYTTLVKTQLNLFIMLMYTEENFKNISINFLNIRNMIYCVNLPNIS